MIQYVCHQLTQEALRVRKTLPRPEFEDIGTVWAVVRKYSDKCYPLFIVSHKLKKILYLELLLIKKTPS